MRAPFASLIGTCIDVTERLRLQDELQALALIDSLRSGAADFIAKPFDVDVLDARLGRLVATGRRRSRAQ